MINLKVYFDSLDIEWGYTEDPVPLSFFEFKKWVDGGFAGPLTYLTDHRMELRSDLRKVYPEFSSAIVFAFPYHHAIKQLEAIYSLEQWNGYKLASYTFGFEGYDYHHVVKNYLKTISKKLKENYPELGTLEIVDTHPILERDLARRAGLGVLGDNTMLIHPKYGSYFMIGAILLNQPLSLPLSSVMAGDCGHCGLCTKKCPASAISETGVDANRCLSTYSIETFKALEPASYFAGAKWFFGCDLCQSVCPWNRKVMKGDEILPLSSKQEQLANFFLLRPLNEIISDLESMSNSAYSKLFKGTSFERTGRMGMLKNFYALRLKE